MIVIYISTLLLYFIEMTRLVKLTFKFFYFSLGSFDFSSIVLVLSFVIVRRLLSSHLSCLLHSLGTRLTLKIAISRSLGLSVRERGRRILLLVFFCLEFHDFLMVVGLLRSFNFAQSF
jgi:hypothetical protein